MRGKDSAPVYVTRSFLPPREEYEALVDKIWENGQLTNKGPLLQEFEKRTAKYLGVDYFQFVTNGTLALQLAIDGLGIAEGEIITTPFSYVATTAAVLWQRCTPVFVDIDEATLNIDPSKIEAAITPNTKAILAVHVFGNACDVDEIERIAREHNLKVIYDGAHAFGARYKGESLLSFGDVSIVSFHATKLFHTIEGGGIISRTKDIHSEIDLKKRFGHQGDEHFVLGMNAKANEFQAAMGLANLPYITDIIEERRRVWMNYREFIEGHPSLSTQTLSQDITEYNFAYAPIIFQTAEDREKVTAALEAINVHPRRYFYPSLNTLSYVHNEQSMPVSEDIASRILCLPLYGNLEDDIITDIKQTIASALV